jgi:hypothetical protein
MDNIYLNNIQESLSFKISSLQVSVPLKGCINNCKSCIAKISGDSNMYKDMSRIQNFDNMYFDQLQKVKEQGCKNIVITSDKGEPMQNKIFMKKIGQFNKQLNDWFNMEIQTTGVLLNDENLSFLKNDVGVKIISVSVFDIFNDKNNLDIIEVKEKIRFNLKEVCDKIKKYGFILRLSINLINVYDKYSIEDMFNKIKKLNPDQVTIKNLWHTEEDNAINKWIKTNKASSNIIRRISEYIENNNGEKISNYRYNMNGISIWMVDNCMLGNYLIIRPDAKLYRSWDTPNSIDL